MRENAFKRQIGSVRSIVWTDRYTGLTNPARADSYTIPRMLLVPATSYCASSTRDRQARRGEMLRIASGSNAC